MRWNCWNNKRTENLVSADREGKWDNHIQAIREVWPIFVEADSTNCLRYTHGTFTVFDNYI